MDTETRYMERALQLARLGEGRVSPNPMVGCVIVRDDRIIGEGWHRHYGQAHAEADAVQQIVGSGNGDSLEGATAFVTLEPCSHFGKTPPCADLLIAHKLRKVIIGTEDPNPLVGGEGIRKLRAAGLEVVTGVLEQECREMNRRFLSGFRTGRPYVILKWAQTTDGFISGPGGSPLRISSPETDVLVHRWRASEDAILVGKNTVLRDNPRLNVRLWEGYNPVRVVLDRRLELPENSRVFAPGQLTIVVNGIKEGPMFEAPERYRTRDETAAVGYLRDDMREKGDSSFLNKLYGHGFRSLLVEGGAATHRHFLESRQWDEIRLIEGNVSAGNGVRAVQPEGVLLKTIKAGGDTIRFYRNAGSKEIR